MSIILRECKGTIYYIDDTGSTRKEHEENLRQVFQRLEQYGLQLKMEKCKLFQEELEFLGHTISKKGISPTKDHGSEKPNEQDGTQILHRSNDL
jgi:hypothetical protein